MSKITYLISIITLISVILISCSENQENDFVSDIACPSFNKTGSDIGGYHPHPLFSSYRLACRDEFNAATIDTKLWRFDAHGNASGWGNNELQFYTDSSDDNAYIDKGFLVIEAKSESQGGKNYTSARLHTHGSLKLKYGIVEARIKLPANDDGTTDSGTWPAFWMLGDNFNGWGHNVYGGTKAWPMAGEIDIMESNSRAHGYNKTLGTLHYSLDDNISQYATKGGNISISNPNSEFHIYSIEWTSKSIKFYLDYTLFFTFTIDESSQGEFQNDFFLLLNLAVGGNFVNAPNSVNYPQKMYVDWVRIYQ